MALDSSRTQLRAITFLGAGAALLVVFGYLLMKSDRKNKRSSSKVSLKKSKQQRTQRKIYHLV
jgi:hypothetical protein